MLGCNEKMLHFRKENWNQSNVETDIKGSK